jgi:hypothetical protein
LPEVPYGYEWSVKGDPVGMFDIASDGTVIAKGAGDGTLHLVLKNADYMGGYEEIFHSVDVSVKPYNYIWKQVTDFSEVKDGDRILIVSSVVNGALTNKVTPREIPASGISNVPVRGFVSTPVTTDEKGFITSPVINGMIWTVEDMGSENCSGGSTANPSYGNRHLRFSNAYPDSSTNEGGSFGNVAMAGTMQLTRVGPENAGAGTTMVMRPSTNHAVTHDDRLDWCFLDHGNGQCSLTNYAHGGIDGGTDRMFALAGINPTGIGVQNGFALSGTNGTGASSVTTIRNRALLKFYKEAESQLAGTISIGDGGTVRVSKTLTADVSALTIEPDLFGDNLGTLSYQWYKDGAAINGENGETYIVRLADLNKLITVEVTSSACAGSLISNSVTVIDREAGDAKYLLSARDDGQVICDFINFTGESVKIRLIFAAYGSDDKLVKVSEPKDVTVTGGDEISVTLDVNTADFKGSTFKVFAWDDNYIPLTEAVTLD